VAGGAGIGRPMLRARRTGRHAADRAIGFGATAGRTLPLPIIAAFISPADTPWKPSA